MPKFIPISVHDLGEYLREQRQSAQLSLRQLSEVAGISNPYISQIERGLKKPSAEILQAPSTAPRLPPAPPARDTAPAAPRPPGPAPLTSPTPSWLTPS